ncbi:MAG: ornithine carbamoyltransferase [Verrucomicrobiota bacterium]|jgi:ornithine carbamoyltransferase|nr:MAG: ornithine carbamoyltransferase [Verrucomicrobiota bacterium]
MKHLLKETDLSSTDLNRVFSLARELKKNRGKQTSSLLSGKTWVLIFSKESTRTRVSFEVGIRELGGNVIFLNKNDIQLGRGETVEDTARVLSRYAHGLVVRTYDHSDVERLASAGSIPVINALTDFLHPCQTLTDAFTAAERWAGPTGDLVESLKGRKIAFLGDTRFNMANSWMLTASMFGMKISLAGPTAYKPGEKINQLLQAGGRKIDYQVTTDPYEAVQGADIVYTDTWTSMGQESEAAARAIAMKPYTVTEKLFAAAKPDAFFMHCLPAHPGEEVVQAVLDNPRSIIFDEAENRLHVQKAIISHLTESK